VNEALNELYIEEEDFTSLRSSIEGFNNFEAIKLAQTIEKHELLEFRRVAALIYKKNQRWSQSVDLSKVDKMYKDAIETAAESKKQDIAEGLLEFFVANSLKECFAACLYTCYDTVRPDVAIELAWKNKILDFSFPYIIQVVREYVGKVDSLYKEFDKKKKSEEKKDEQSSFVAPEESFMHTLPQIAYYPTGQDPNQFYGQQQFGVGGMPGNGYGFQ